MNYGQGGYNMSASSMMSNNSNNGQVNIESVLTDIERPYYLSILQKVSGDGQKTDSRIVGLLKSSQLSQDQLKELWSKYASSSSSELSRLQFFTMMRAVGFTQKGISDMDQLMLSRNFPYLPTFQGIPAPNLPPTSNFNPQYMNVAFPPISDELLREYEDQVERNQTQVKGILRAAEARSILSKSQLDRYKLKQIWDLCDTVEDNSTPGGKGFLRRNEWILCLHLIRFGQQGYPIPNHLPVELKSFMSNYSMTKMSSQQGIGSDSFSKKSNSITVDTSSNNYSHLNSIHQPSTSLTDTNTIRGPHHSASLPAGTGVARHQHSPQMIELMERAFKGYEIICKKFTDAADEYSGEIAKVSQEKTRLLQELEKEMAEMEKELNNSKTLKQQLVDEANRLNSTQNQPEVAQELEKLKLIVGQNDITQKAHQAITQINQRMSSTKIQTGQNNNSRPIPPLQQVDHPAHHTQITSAPQMQEPPAHVVMNPNQPQTHGNHDDDEDDMFAS